MATTRESMTEEEWNLLENIGLIFYDLRTEAGYTQREAAQLLNTSQARLPVLENGKADVMLTTLVRWAKLYNHTVEVILVPIEDDLDKAIAETATESTKEMEQ